MMMGEVCIGEVNGVRHDTIGQLTEIGVLRYDIRRYSTLYII